jgi:hypothetical protein
MKKFEKEDIFYTTIKAHPKARFFCYDGKIYYNNSTEEGLVMSKFLLLTTPPASLPPDNVILTEASELLITEDGDYLIIE